MAVPAKDFESAPLEREGQALTLDSGAKEAREEMGTRTFDSASFAINNSVGLGGINAPEDVLLILNDLKAYNLIDQNSYDEETYMAAHTPGNVSSSLIPGVIAGIEKWQRYGYPGEVTRQFTPGSDSYAAIASRSVSRDEVEGRMNNALRNADISEGSEERLEINPAGAAVLVFPDVASNVPVHEITAPTRVIEARDTPYGIKFIRIDVDGQEVSGYVDNTSVSTVLKTVEIVAERIKPEPRNTVLRKDATIWEEASPSSEVIATLPRNSRIFFKDSPYDGWALVELPDGKQGYTVIHNLAMRRPMPDPEAILHNITPGTRLESVINEHYMNEADEDRDRRYYANVILHVNNPDNDTGPEEAIYVEGGDSFFHRQGINYDDIVYRTGYDIWVPGKGFADTLKGKISSGSYYEIFSSAKRGAIDTVDEWWPKGLGITLDAGIGLTFGVPSGDVNLGMYFYRKDEDSLVVQKRAELAAGAEVGVGAGFFLGKKPGDKGSYGAGASATANAEAKGTLYGLLEYEFPFKEDEAVISALATITNQEGSVPMLVASFLDTLGYLQINPMDYITKAKVAVGARGEANAGVFAGARMSGGRNYGEAWSQSNRAPANQAGVPVRNPFKPKEFLMSFLQIGADAQLALEGRYGVEYGRENYRSRDGEYKAKNESATFFVEASALANLNINLPMIPMPTLGLEQGVGVKITTTIDHTARNPKWSSPEVSLVAMSGELDYYAGPASEIEMDGGEVLKAGAEALQNLSLTADTFKDLVQSTKITKRVALNAGILSTPFERVLRNQRRFGAFLGSEAYSKYGLSMNGYLTLAFNLSNLSDSIIDKIIETVRPMGDSDQSMYQKGIELIQHIVNGTTSALDDLKEGEINNLINEIFGENKTVDGSIHLSLNGGIAGGASAGVGAKLKLDGHLIAGVTFEQDILPFLQNFVNNRFIGEIFNNIPSEASVENLMQHLMIQPDGLGDFLNEILPY